MSAADASAAIHAVRVMYTQATTQLPAILRACANDEARDEVWAEYFALRKSFDDVVNQKFEEDDAELMQLEQEANASAQQIAGLGSQLGNLVKVLATLAEAVGIGVKIAGKVVAA